MLSSLILVMHALDKKLKFTRKKVTPIHPKMVTRRKREKEEWQLRYKQTQKYTGVKSIW